MKLRSFFSVLISVVVVLLLIAGVGWYWLLAQSPLSLLKGSPQTNPEAVMFVPRQAPAMVSLLVNPERLASFRLAAVRPGERRHTRAELKQLQQSLLANTGLDYTQDIKPWLGKELTLAVTTLDIDRDSTNGKQPGYLLAIATQNSERSREFLQLFWQKRAIAGADLVFEQYKGVKIIHGSSVGIGQKTEGRGQKAGGKTQNSKPKTQNAAPATPPPTPALSSAAVGDRFILFANHPKVLRDAINNVQAPDLSLTSASFYNQTLQTLTEPRIGLTYVNLPGLATWLGESPPSSGATTGTIPAKPGESSSPAVTESPSPYQTLAVALKLDRQGLLADTALVAKDGKGISVSPPLSQPVAALQYIPASSSLAASGLNLDRVWRGLSQDLNRYRTVAKLVNQPLADLQKRWGIDLPRDVFSWVKGEYALGLVPEGSRGNLDLKTQNSKLNPTLVNDWVFVAQRETDAAKQGIERLDTIAQKQGLSVGPVQLDNQTISTWTKLTAGTGKQDSLALQAQVQGVHATVGNYEIFTTSIASMDRALKAVAGSLPRGDRFQQAISPLLQPNNGYLYLDWATSQPLLEQQFPLLKVVNVAGQPLLKHLQSLTISSYGSQSGVQRGGVFIKLS
ncbi:DUF3352 domain-containing protein [Kovacikia minuta CCNUW1]|uniref:DUF3352 domain-containing protein n=1 Tax=Kovacikia minuta TaxID=2931930 RepID=UPI001CCD79D1|nr:DUF3352 domain-containing protein [Kovacikia minuta]UBF26878.1 DUF3352 domain-containing protein [Kovacikia minuta CCNUW1]